jgi:hypothetical protein
VDLLLGPLDVGDVMEDPVAEDDVEGVVREGQVKNTRLVETLEGQFSQGQAHPCPSDRRIRQVHSGPPGAAPDQLLRLGSLTETDLQYVTSSEVQAVQASGNVGFQPVLGCVVPVEERFVVLSLPALRCAQELITARMTGPETLDFYFLHRAPQQINIFSITGKPGGFIPDPVHLLTVPRVAQREDARGEAQRRVTDH